MIRILPAILLLVAGCYRPPAMEGELKSRVNNPYYFLVGEHDPEYDDAARQAQYSLTTFLRALDDPRPSQSNFAIKAIIEEGRHTEAVWITSLEFDGKTFYGKVNNDPIHLRKVFIGTKVSVDQARIRDWMFVDNGRLQGGYSLKVLHRKLSPDQRKRMEQSMDFNLN